MTFNHAAWLFALPLTILNCFNSIKRTLFVDESTRFSRILLSVYPDREIHQSVCGIIIIRNCITVFILLERIGILHTSLQTIWSNRLDFQCFSLTEKYENGKRKELRWKFSRTCSVLNKKWVTLKEKNKTLVAVEFQCFNPSFPKECKWFSFLYCDKPSK